MLLPADLLRRLSEMWPVLANFVYTVMQPYVLLLMRNLLCLVISVLDNLPVKEIEISALPYFVKGFDSYRSNVWTYCCWEISNVLLRLHE